MAVRFTVVSVLGLWLGLGTARADTFGGFSSVDKPYLVNSDKVCTPIRVTGGKATGAPDCKKAAADVIAKLAIKQGTRQTGNPNAKFAARASGRTLTVSRKPGDTLFTYQTFDPIKRVVDVYASQYEDRVAVAYTTRVMGREQTFVIGFDLLRPGAKPPTGHPDPTHPTTTTPTGPEQPRDPDTGVIPDPPAIKKLVDAAAKTPRRRQLAAWKKVLAADAEHAQALYRIAVLEARARHEPAALAELELLAKSSKPDAIEWRIEARFEKAFASMRGDARFRTAVGLDQKPATSYERVMRFGGGWEQAGTTCDKAEVRMKLQRERTFRLHVITACQGMRSNLPFRGKWRIEPGGITLILPNHGKATSADEARCVFEPHGDEEALHCDLGKGIDFVVLPARR